MSSIAPIGPPPNARLKQIVTLYATSAAKLSAWMEANLPQGFAVFALPLLNNSDCVPATPWNGSTRNSNAAPASPASSPMKPRSYG